MKRTIRASLFETNSSSSHALTWGEGAFQCPYELALPDEPEEDDYSTWEDWYEDYQEYEQAVREAVPVGTPSWDDTASWERSEHSGAEYPVVKYTLYPETFNKLSALLWLVSKYTGIAGVRDWSERLNEMFVGIDMQRFIGEVEDWNGQYIDDDEAMAILDELSDDDALARFLFDDETTIVARYVG